MVVKNVNNALKITCGCGGWLTHWRRFGKPSAGFAQRQACAVVVCGNPIEVGAHVQKEVLEGMRTLDMVGDASWYVLPLCRDCSRKVGAFLTVDDGCGLAPASIAETCGRAEAADPSSMSA